VNVPADDDLLHAYLEGGLSAAEARGLEERLKAEPSLAEALVRLAREEAVLREWACADRAARDAAAEILGAWTTLPGREGESGPPDHSRRPSGRSRSRRPSGRSRSRLAFPLVWWFRAAAVLLALAATSLAILLLLSGERPSRGAAGALAQVSSIHGEVWRVTTDGQVLGADVQQDLFPGEEVRVGGEGAGASVQYPDGTRLDLSAETVLRFEADGGLETPGVGKRLFLQTGLVDAEVAGQPEGRPMFLSTPHAVIRALRTRFSSATTAEATQVELEEGRLHLTRLSDGRSIVVEKDRFAVAAARPEPLVTQPLPPRVTKPRIEIANQPGPVLAVAFAPDGRTLGIAGADGTVVLWDRRTGKVRDAFKAHEKRTTFLTFSPDGAALASVGGDRAVKFWDPATGDRLLSLNKPRPEVNALALSPDGRSCATALGYPRGAKGTEQILLWDARTGQELGRLTGHRDAVQALAYSPDAKTLASGARDGTIKLWDLAARRERQTLAGHVGPVNALAFAPDGKTLASGGKDRMIRLWEVETGEVRQVLEGNAREVKSLAFSPDGSLLAAGGGDSLARLWEVGTGRKRMDFKGHKKNSIPTVAFAPDGTLLATGGSDRRVLLWDVVERLLP
jgi:WD40 repeat protein